MDDKWSYCPAHSGIQRDIEALKERMNYSEAAQEKALAVAKTEVDRRLAGMNNFQSRIDRQENLFATKVEVQSLMRLIWIGVGIFLAIEIGVNVLMR